MIETTIRGLRDARDLLQEIRDRARDPSPAWDAIADDIFAGQRRWWALAYGGRTDADDRPDRDSRFMYETGGLQASATRRGASRQTVDVSATGVLVEVTHGLGVIHEARDRDVLSVPSARDVDGYAERVGDYILTGRR